MIKVPNHSVIANHIIKVSKYMEEDLLRKEIIMCMDAIHVSAVMKIKEEQDDRTKTT